LGQRLRDRPMIAGALLLVGFFRWEAVLGRRPGGQPLVDLNLFRSRNFTWGVILLAVSGVAMMGGLFTLPQYFQGILGVDPMGSGFRLLPLIAGLVVGAVPGARLAVRLGPKLVIAAGFAIFGIGCLIGANMTLASGTAFTATWLAVVGLGLGLVFAPAARRHSARWTPSAAASRVASSRPSTRPAVPSVPPSSAAP